MQRTNQSCGLTDRLLQVHYLSAAGVVGAVQVGWRH